MANKQEGQPAKKGTDDKENLKTDYPLSEKDEVKKAEERTAENVQKAQKDKTDPDKKNK